MIIKIWKKNYMEQLEGAGGGAIDSAKREKWTHG